ncbi:hypothetical protein [Streptomyces sp. TRM64462]|uniref:hypothetical protein n=1 Tax=Streptomyces sp. TRM64462 TaxID=2741726 RepID=UPI001585D284|nr:hypothetical protein [Streptomyces sp. TRM64462]
MDLISVLVLLLLPPAMLCGVLAMAFYEDLVLPLADPLDALEQVTDLDVLDEATEPDPRPEPEAPAFSDHLEDRPPPDTAPPATLLDAAAGPAAATPAEPAGPGRRSADAA